MNCRSCENKIPNDAKFCNKCGSKIELQEEVVDIEFFSISTTRLVILSILTLGLYEIYWFYRNWEAIKKSEKQKISPVGRAIFTIFYCNNLFKKVLKLAQKNGYKDSYSPILISTIYIILLLIGNIWGKTESLDIIVNVIFLVITSLSSIPLIWVQKAINFNNSKISENNNEESKFTKGEVVITIIGIILFIFSILGIFSGYRSNSNLDRETVGQSKVYFIKETVDSLKKELVLPNKLDEVTTLVDVTAEPTAIRYHYELSGVDQNIISNDFLKNYLIKDICGNSNTKYLLNQDINMEYSYLDLDTQLPYFIYFSKEDCNIN